MAPTPEIVRRFTGEPDGGGWYAMISRPRTGSFGAMSQVAMIAGFTAVIIALNMLTISTLGQGPRTIALLIIALSAAVCWLWLAGLDSTPPVMPFMMLIYSAYYAAPVFLLAKLVPHPYGPRFPDDLVERALAYTLIGLSCMVAGYYGPHNRPIRLLIPKPSFRWKNVGLLSMWGKIFASVGLFFNLAGSRISLPGPLAQLGAYANDLSFIGIFMLFALQLVGKLDRASILILWCLLIPGRFVSGLASGATGQGLMVALTAALVWATIRRRMPWTVFFAGALVFVIMRPVEAEYRAMTWPPGPYSDASELEKIALLGRLSLDAITGTPQEHRAMLELSAGRLAAVQPFATVLRATPDSVPFWEGETYYPILFKPIPRFLFPDKPEEVSGQTFGHRYGLLDARNLYTSINLPQLVELYVNFGLGGILVGMFIFGTAYRLLCSLLFHPAMGFGNLVAGLYLAGKLYGIESAASMAAGGLFWGFVTILLIHLVIDTGEAISSAAVPA